jgi:hypothetical protein
MAVGALAGRHHAIFESSAPMRHGVGPGVVAQVRGGVLVRSGGRGVVAQVMGDVPRRPERRPGS